MLPERWEKCVDSGGEYVEDCHLQVSVWQLWFKQKNSVPVIFEPPCTTDRTAYTNTSCMPCSHSDRWPKTQTFSLHISQGSPWTDVELSACHEGRAAHSEFCNSVRRQRNQNKRSITGLGKPRLNIQGTGPHTAHGHFSNTERRGHMLACGFHFHRPSYSCT
jgi:hypothetical protein